MAEGAVSRGRTPLLITCQGASARAQLAGQVGGALQDLGAAETQIDTERVVVGAQAGRAVVALDGCPSACSAQLLEARGVSPSLAVNLSELGLDQRIVSAGAVTPARIRSLAAEIAGRIRQQPHTGRRRRVPRPSGPEVPPGPKRAHGVDDYLLAVDALASTVVPCGALSADAPTLAAHVSHLLGVSRVSVGEMLVRLEASELVKRSVHKELTLTTNGRLAADRAVRRHRLLECLATDYLGYTLADSYEHARLLDGGFDEEAIERVSRALGEPQRCPHGWPIDPSLARTESRELATLATLSPGERATVARLVEQDGPALARLCELGLLPGTAVELDRDELGAVLRVTIAGHARALDRELAARVLVRRDS